jgi:hypothetical protein
MLFAGKNRLYVAGRVKTNDWSNDYIQILVIEYDVST